MAAQVDTRVLDRPLRSLEPVGEGLIKAAHPATVPLLRGVATGYEQIVRAAVNWGPANWLLREHFLFFLLATGGFLLLVPRFFILGGYAIERVVLGVVVAKPDLSAWPYIPNYLLPMLAVALVTFFAGVRVRFAALGVTSAIVALAFGYLDLVSLPLFAGFVMVAYGIIRMPVPRWAAALGLAALATLLLIICAKWFPEADFTRIASFQTALIPMLWYSAYEHKSTRRPLSLKRFVPYLYYRFFSGPVVTYADTSPVEGKRLAEVRLGGIKALYIAAFASIAAAISENVQQQFAMSELNGISLLALSYATYVGSYCRIVVGFNVVIGLLRLFGFPVRDNFHYWLLARTPNEHWQRWNMLFREWVITFVFFPIMRTRRWLFTALLCSLLTSGLLHILPEMIVNGVGPFQGTLELLYWTLNALAIYLVIKIPQVSPRIVGTLKIDAGPLWSAIGIVMTSAFYAVLHGAKTSSEGWADVTNYFVRLLHIF